MRNFIVTIDGKSYSVGVEEVGETEDVVVPLHPAVDEKKAAPAPKAQESTAGVKVSSPFPGIIKNLLVADGTTVKKDQSIMVLEAMKMDNDITSPSDGTVHFAVTKGQNVETNALLATIS